MCERLAPTGSLPPTLPPGATTRRPIEITRIAFIGLAVPGGLQGACRCVPFPRDRTHRPVRRGRSMQPPCHGGQSVAWVPLSLSCVTDGAARKLVLGHRPHPVETVIETAVRNWCWSPGRWRSPWRPIRGPPKPAGSPATAPPVSTGSRSAPRPSTTHRSRRSAPITSRSISSPSSPVRVLPHWRPVSSRRRMKGPTCGTSRLP